MSLVPERFSLREWSWLTVGSVGAVLFVFLVPPTPWDALDFRSILLPYLTFSRTSFLAGEFPFWNPYASLGRPFAADPQAIVFWPPGIVYLILGPFVGVLVLSFAHTLFAAWSSARLCLRMGAARLPALFSGLVFVLSGKLTGHYQAGHVQFVFSYLYLPGLLWCAVNLREEPRAARGVAFLGLISGLQLLAGAPQVYWNCAIAVALFLFGSRVFGPGPRLAGLVRDSVRTIGGYALGTGLAAVQLVPLAELVKESNRAGSRPEFTGVGSMGWPHWLTFLSPETIQPEMIDWEMLLYPGVAITLLGCVGLFRVKDKNVRGLLAMTLGAVLIAAGSNTPLFDPLCRWLPGYASFRVHGRTGAVLVYLMIVSAMLLVSDPRPRRWAWGVGALGVAAFVTTVLLPRGLVFGFWPQSSWVLRPLVILFLSTMVLCGWLWVARPKLSAALAVLSGGVLLADLVATDLWLKRTYITSQNYAAETDLVQALWATGYLRPGAPPPRVFGPPRMIRANGGMIHGYATFAGSEALALARIWHYVHWAVGREQPMFSDIYLFSAFAARGSFPIPWVSQVGAINEATRQIEIHLPQNPRVWLNDSVRVVPGWREAVGRLADGHDAAKSALLEKPLAANVELDGSSPPGSARITNFRRNTVDVAVETHGRSVLVLAEAWYPGWAARINGHEAAVFPANGWMRAVLVPKGISQVQFFYRPTHFAMGAAGSLVALGLLIWMVRRSRVEAERGF